MTTRIVLVRHGQTAWNRETRFRGRADVPLDSVSLPASLPRRSARRAGHRSRRREAPCQAHSVWPAWIAPRWR